MNIKNKNFYNPSEKAILSALSKNIELQKIGYDKYVLKEFNKFINDRQNYVIDYIKTRTFIFHLGSIIINNCHNYIEYIYEKHINKSSYYPEKFKASNLLILVKQILKELDHELAEEYINFDKIENFNKYNLPE